MVTKEELQELEKRGEIPRGLLDFLWSLDERVDRTNKLLEEILEALRRPLVAPVVRIPEIEITEEVAERLAYVRNVEDFQILENLYANLERKGYTEPVLAYADISVGPGASWTGVISLPPNRYCVQRVFEIYSQDPENSKYGWRIDSVDPAKESVPLHIVVPNVAPNTERSIFGRWWVKTKFLYLMLENIHPTDTIVFRVRAWAQYTTPETYENFIDPVFTAQLRKLEARAEYLRTGRFPPSPLPVRGSLPGPTKSPPPIDPTYECLECHSPAEVVFRPDGRPQKVDFRDRMALEGKSPAFWGEAHPCPLLQITSKPQAQSLVSQGLIKEV